MSNKIHEALEELKAVLRIELPESAVAARIFISGTECSIDIETRSSEQLRSGAISMKNMRGEFIK